MAEREFKIITRSFPRLPPAHREHSALFPVEYSPRFQIHLSLIGCHVSRMGVACRHSCAVLMVGAVRLPSSTCLTDSWGSCSSDIPLPQCSQEWDFLDHWDGFDRQRCLCRVAEANSALLFDRWVGREEKHNGLLWHGLHTTTPLVFTFLSSTEVITDGSLQYVCILR